MTLHQRRYTRHCLFLQKHGDWERSRSRGGDGVNPAANVKTVARLKSMGDGWSSHIGSVMAVMTGGWECAVC